MSVIAVASLAIGLELWQAASEQLPATATTIRRIVCKQGQQIGDLNNDKKIDIVDVQLMADVIVRKVKPPVNYCCADVNSDGLININDQRQIVLMARGDARLIGVCANAPKSIHSAYRPHWAFLKIGGGWPVFYTANGLIMDSQTYVYMTLHTPLIESLAAQIPEGVNDHETVQNIMDWMHQYMESKSPANNNCNNAQRLRRAAHAILTPIPPNDKPCAVSCADWGTAFIALARAKGIPAAMVYTVSDRWINQTLSNGCTDTMYGHVIADVYTSTSGPNGGWELADPTFKVFTVYEDDNYSGNALMRFNAFTPGSGLSDFGSGEPYRVFRRAIDTWDAGLTDGLTWEKQVAKKYGLPRNKDGTIVKCPSAAKMLPDNLYDF